MTAMPPALERFGVELETAARRDLRSRRRRRLLSLAAVPAAIAAFAVALLVGLPEGGAPAIERAAAALQISDETILHVRLLGEQHNPDGSVVTWRSESWQLAEAPYTRRQIEVQADGIRAESLTRGDTNELYDAKRDTIYVASRNELTLPSKVEIVSRARLRKLVPGAHVQAAYLKASANGYKVIATKEGAKRFAAHAGGKPQESSGAEDPFRSEILAMLNSGRAEVAGHVEVDGRDAIRIESSDGKQAYLVDAATYSPIQWTSTGDGGSVTLSFPAYEELPADAESMQVFDLSAQHPGAQVVHDPDAYRAAEARLFPHG